MDGMEELRCVGLGWGRAGATSRSRPRGSWDCCHINDPIVMAIEIIDINSRSSWCPLVKSFAAWPSTLAV